MDYFRIETYFFPLDRIGYEILKGSASIWMFFQPVGFGNFSHKPGAMNEIGLVIAASNILKVMVEQVATSDFFRSIRV